MEEADYLCHRIGLMNKGKIVVVDSPSALYGLFTDFLVLALTLLVLLLIGAWIYPQIAR